MKAVQFREYGGPEVLEVAEVPEPHAGPGQVRIRVAASSVNPIDWKVRAGYLAGGKSLESPQISGSDAAGYVDEVGEGAEGVAVGDEVFGIGGATIAEYAVLRSWTAKPPSVDWAVAAAAGVAGETAVRVLNLLGISSGSTVFIDGGAGGVGAVAVQVALARGATVLASGSERNDDYLREIGAIPVRYGEGVVQRVREAAGRDTVDGVFDVVGKTPAEDLISLAPEPAQVVSIANFGAGDTGIRLTAGGEGDPQAALAEIAGLLAGNRLVIKTQTFPFERAAEAHQLSQDGHVRGKLVLLP